MATLHVTSPLTIEGLETDEDYEFRIVTVKEVSPGVERRNESDPVTCTPGAILPVKVINLKAEEDDETLKITWTVPTPDPSQRECEALQFTIAYKKHTEGENKWVWTNPVTSGYTITDLENGVLYDIKVKSYGAKEGRESVSSTITATPMNVEWVSWSTGTDEQITKIIEAYYKGSVTLDQIKTYWKVGDDRPISTTGDTNFLAGTCYMRIIDFCHDDLATPVTTASGTTITKALLSIAMSIPKPNTPKIPGDYYINTYTSSYQWCSETPAGAYLKVDTRTQSGNTFKKEVANYSSYYIQDGTTSNMEKNRGIYTHIPLFNQYFTDLQAVMPTAVKSLIKSVIKRYRDREPHTNAPSEAKIGSIKTKSMLMFPPSYEEVYGTFVQGDYKFAALTGDTQYIHYKSSHEVFSGSGHFANKPHRYATVGAGEFVNSDRNNRSDRTFATRTLTCYTSTTYSIYNGLNAACGSSMSMPTNYDYYQSDILTDGASLVIPHFCM